MAQWDSTEAFALAAVMSRRKVAMSSVFASSLTSLAKISLRRGRLTSCTSAKSFLLLARAPDPGDPAK